MILIRFQYSDNMLSVFYRSNKYYKYKIHLIKSISSINFSLTIHNIQQKYFKNKNINLGNVISTMMLFFV